jgi:hypothetical protein
LEEKDDRFIAAGNGSATVGRIPPVRVIPDRPSYKESSLIFPVSSGVFRHAVAHAGLYDLDK